MTIYLYVKQHSITKLKYFGMSRRKDINRYKGSGKYWKRHLKKHGSQYVITTDIWAFEDENLCEQFALQFSREHNIVESSDWANLQDENGKEGLTRGAKIFPNGRVFSDDHRLAMSKAAQKPRSENWKASASKLRKGRSLSPEHRLAVSNGLKGMPKNYSPEMIQRKSELAKRQITCIHCNRTFAIGPHNRYHGDKCKLKISSN